MVLTLKNVAQEAGVSKATVSYVLADRRDVKIPEHTRKKVLETAKRLGYQPNRIARILALGQSHLITLWVPVVNNGIFPEIINLAQICCRRDNYDLIVCQYHTYVKGNEASGHLLEHLADGGLAWSWGTEDEFSDTSRLVEIGILPTRKTDCVWIDFKPAILEALTSLYDSGRRRIAILVPESVHLFKDPRNDAYYEFIRTAGLEPQVILFPGMSKASAGSAIEQYLDNHSVPDALFCIDDSFAIAAYKTLKSKGLRIPDDISIIGCDGLEETLYQDPPISTIEAPLEEMIEKAWETLLAKLENPSKAVEHIRLEARFLRRESS